jgi:hypothetical protein
VTVRKPGRRGQWTDAEVRDALRAWLDKTNDPSRRTYNLAQHGNRDLPSLGTIDNRLGGWAKAVRELSDPGYIGAPRFTTDDILAAVQTWLDNGGNARPTAYDAAAKGNRSMPTATIIRKRFGSWQAALNAVGADPPQRRWTPHNVHAALAAWITEHPHATAPQYRSATKGNTDFPSATTIDTHLGSWRQARTAVGVGPLERRWSPDKVRAVAAAWITEHPHATWAQYRNASRGNVDLPSSTTIRRHIGSWQAARDAIGAGTLRCRWTPDTIRVAVHSWLDEHPDATWQQYQAAAKGNADLPSLRTIKRKGSWRQLVHARRASATSNHSAG